MTLVLTDWRELRDAHQHRIGPWVQAHRDRAARGVKHPVHDFLFTYYSFRPAQLLRWSPGVNAVLNDGGPDECDWPQQFKKVDGGLAIDVAKFPFQRISYLNWAIDYLEAVSIREPVFHCFGLHEWAMLYRTDDVRHAATPLRVSPAVIADVVESQGLRCTHYDAFRFFTPEAVRRNRVELTRVDAVHHDQPGCIHATMDLYKFAYKLAPFTSAELIADAFDLAMIARAIDMRASPYDLQSLGYEPIEIETKAGREYYAQLQRQLMATSQPLRRRVREEYRAVLAATTKDYPKQSEL